MISGGILSLLITIVVVGLIFYLCWWGLGAIGLPQPFDKVIRVILVLLVVIFLINALLGFNGTPLFGPIHTIR